MTSTNHDPSNPPDRDSASESPVLAYEAPDTERSSSAMPTEQQLERELPPRAGRAHDPYAALRIGHYRLFAAAFCASVIGGQTQNVAVGWQIYQKTNSAMSLGWLGLVMATPILLLALPAGHVADTFSRRRIMLVTHSVSAACALALALVAHLNLGGAQTVSAIYALMFVGNAGATFGRPARSAFMPQLVPPHVFPNAVTWNSSIFEVASVAGPAIGGLLCWRSVTLAFVFAACCWCGTLVGIYFLPNRAAPGRATRDARRGPMPSLGDLVAGVRFVVRSKLMLGAMTLDMFAVLLGGCTFLLPIFAKDILHVGALGFGFLRAAPSVGAIAMALTIAHTPPFRNAGRALLLAVAGFGAVTIAFGLSRNFALSFAMLVLLGAFDNVSVVIRHTLIQLLTPDAMRGRVSAVNQVFIGSSNEIGGLESGLTAAWLGPVTSVVMGGIGTILVVIGVASIWPQVRKLKSLADVKPDTLDDRPPAPAHEPAPAATAK